MAKAGHVYCTKKQCVFQITPIEGVQSDRICGICIAQPNACPLYAFSVYMPSVNYPITDYIDGLNTLQGLYDSYSSIGTVIICGDFNAMLTTNPSNIEIGCFRALSIKMICL